MKGLVFTQVLAMAEEAIGEEGVDELLDALDFDHDGAYTSVGNYPCSELMQIVAAVSARTGLSGDQLQFAFGTWMHDYFLRSHGEMFEDKPNVLHMLESIEGEVHKEVRKLYDDVELPTFETEWLGPRSLRMTYRSVRPLRTFCHGLIEACVAHFGTPAEVTVTDRSTADETIADFVIALRD